MSLINTLKSKGPRTDPWGIPERTSKGDGGGDDDKNYNYNNSIQFFIIYVLSQQL
jgi:hypothetical protein